MAYIYGFNKKHEWVQLWATCPIEKDLHKKGPAATKAYMDKLVYDFQFELKHVVSWECAAGCGRPAHELL